MFRSILLLCVLGALLVNAAMGSAATATVTAFGSKPPKGNNGATPTPARSPRGGRPRRRLLPASIPPGGAKKEPTSDDGPVVKRTLTPADLALAGAVATMIGDATLHPIDCIKTLQQSNEGAGLGFFGAGKKIWTDSGAGGFYSGLGTYVTADGGAGALKFATYEGIKKWMGDKIPEEYVGATLFGCAALAYMASSVVLVPGELIKQRLQMGQVNSVGDAIVSIWKAEGIKGFFAGASGVWIRDIPYTALELGIYDNVKELCLSIKKRNQKAGEEEPAVTQLDEIIAAAVSGGITAFLTNPLDLVKTKLMVNADLYTGFADALRKTVQEGGIAGLFNGAGARVSYVMPFCTLYLPCYEVIKRRLEARAPRAAKEEKTGSPLNVKRGGAQARMQARRQQQQMPARGGSLLLGGSVVQSSSNQRRRHPMNDNKCFVSF